MNNKYAPSLEAATSAARTAAYRLAQLSTTQKNTCLQAAAEALRQRVDEIVAAARADVEAMRKTHPELPDPDNSRLVEPDTVETLARSMQVLAGIGDPVGRIDATWIRPNGLKIEKVRVPIGVVAVVSSGGPVLPAETAGICIKTGNALILHETESGERTRAAFIEVMREAARQTDVPETAVQFLPEGGWEMVRALITGNRLVDVVIPRGKNEFVQRVGDTATVPVIRCGQGVCHLYVDEDADLDMAFRIIENSVCRTIASNDAVSVVLIHTALGETLAPMLAERMEGCGLEMRGDKAVCDAVPGLPPALEEDWTAGAGNGVLAIRAVADVDDAIAWINEHGTGYSDAVITRNRATAGRFSQAVDSACVYVNASTRFTEGAQFGMGGQIGFSTDRLHARGPLGTEELTTYKYVAVGAGQVREPGS